MKEKYYLFSLMLLLIFFYKSINSTELSQKSTNTVTAEANKLPIQSSGILQQIKRNSFWRTILLRNLVILIEANCLYLGAKLYNEWSDDCRLSKNEKRFLWHESLIFILIANYCCQGLLCCSSSASNDKEKEVEDRSCVELNCSSK